MAEVADVFAEKGVLQQSIQGFQPRTAQLEMANAIEKLLASEQGQLIVEAETGTGKTFAYVVPVLLGEHKAIISTGTKNLQEQLYYRDLPTLRNALAPQKKVALLKGRANYLCIHRLEQTLAHSGEYAKNVQQQLVATKRWANSTATGDIGEISVLAEDAAALPLVTSTVDNCLGRDCPAYDDCYLVKARKKALEADIVVVNHHLFFADMALKDVGFGELIPAAGAVVFDEAHQIPDIASQYFGESLSSRQLHELAQEAKVLYLTEVKDLRQLDSVADKLISALRDWRLVFPQDPTRGNWREWIHQAPMVQTLERISEALELLTDVCRNALGRHQDLDNIYERCVSFATKWEQLLDTTRTGYSFWYETTMRQVSLHQTPLSVADKFGSYVRFSEMRWIFTSATIAIGDNFDHYQRQLGLYEAKTLRLTSPFAFEQQAMLCLPRFLAQPHEREMLGQMLDIIRQVEKVNHGGTFVLFTSHRMLRLVAERLADEVWSQSERQLFVQGDTNKRELLNSFVAAENAILLGTASFWEGVDVRGDALRCVIIDKLPFASPDEPLLQARVEDCRMRGIDPFGNVQLPQAVITLKQGAGRLIRDQKDTGVLIVCDNRLVTKPYGAKFIASLPPMQRTRSLQKALDFLADVEKEPS